MTEKSLTSLFAKYIKLHPRENTECFEFKMVKSKSFNIKVVKQHQIDGLLSAGEGVWHKISDSPIYAGMKTRFTLQKPFDGVFIKSQRNYVCPIFYQPHSYKKVFLIPIKEFLKFTKSVKMTELEAMNFESFYL